MFSWLSPRNRDNNNNNNNNNNDNPQLKKCEEEKEAEIKKREEAEKEAEEARAQVEARARENDELRELLEKKKSEFEELQEKPKAGEKGSSQNPNELLEQLENAREEVERAQLQLQKFARETEELKKDLAEEQKERASLLTRVNAGGGVKKKSLVASILQWDKENPEGIPDDFEEIDKNKETNQEYSFDFTPRSTPSTSPTTTPNEPSVAEPSPRKLPPFFKKKSTVLWGKAAEGSKMEVAKKKALESPMDYIAQLKQVSRLSLTFLKQLDKKLHTVDSSWLVEFIAEGGFTAIIEAENYIEQVKNKKVSDAVIQINLVLCIRSLFNNEATLDVVTKDHSFVKTLVHTTEGTKNVLMKAKLLELFSALCLYSKDGYEAVVDAFESLHPAKSRYSVVVRMVSQEPDTQFRRAGVSLINALIFGKSDFIERSTVRKEFIREGLVNALHIVEADNSLDPDEPLSRQLSVFQQAWDVDHEEEVCNSFSFLYFLFILFYLFIFLFIFSSPFSHFPTTRHNVLRIWVLILPIQSQSLPKSTFSLVTTNKPS